MVALLRYPNRSIYQKNKIDIICLSEKYFDSTFPLNDERLYTTGYLTIRTDHPRNTEREGVCIYYKEYLTLIRKIYICKLNECIVTEITANNERCYLTCLLQIAKSKPRAVWVLLQKSHTCAFRY